MDNRPLYSADIAEIIGTPPRWIMRAGSGWLLLLLLLVLGVASVVKIPERSQTPILISGSTQPYYLVQGETTGVPLVAAGQVVESGQRLAEDASAATGYLRAPFKGTLFYEKFAASQRRPGDTVAILVPSANAYRFSGRAVPGQIGELRKQLALQLRVPLDSLPDTSLELRGRLGYVAPGVHNGLIAYAGQLDSASNALLVRRLGATTSLGGTLVVSSRRQSLLKRFFN